MSDEVKGLKKRPRYDPIIEDLNQKASDEASKRLNDPRLNIEVSHEAQTSEGRSDGLTQHGKRVAPSKTSYLGSFCVHIYEERRALSKRNQLMSLSPGLNKIPQQLAIQALEALSLHIMHLYGVTPKGTLDEKRKKEQQIRDNR